MGFFIKNAENLNVIPESVEDEGLKYAYQSAEKHNWTKAELEAYDYVLMREQDDRGRMSFAVKKAAKIAAKNAAKEMQIEIATNIIKLGFSIELVAQNTGLTIEEVQKLNSEI